MMNNAPEWHDSVRVVFPLKPRNRRNGETAKRREELRPGLRLAGGGVSRLRLGLTGFWILAALATLAAAPLSVRQVDPPGWFTDLKLKKILLLVAGEGLDGTRIDSRTSALKPRVLNVSADGRYLFAELEIGAKAKPGVYSLQFKHGAESVSRPFDLRPSCRKEYEPAGFSPKDVVYLLMPDRFADGNPANNVQPATARESSRSDPRGWHGGDFAGLLSRLDYFQDLGIGAIWLTPICENAGPIAYHGYHATDFYRADPHFGTIEEFADLVRKAHARGIKVIQDQVVNHTGPAHPWVASPPTATWFNGTSERHLSCDWNIPGLANPHAPENARDLTVRGWFAGILPDLNLDDPLLARYLIQNSVWWVARTGLDGIRLDTYPYCSYEFWKRWFPAIRREFPHLSVVGEAMAWLPPQVAYWQKDQVKVDGTSEGPESLMDFPASIVLPAAYLEETGWTKFRDVYSQDYAYPHPEMLFTLLDNHDTPRLVSALGGPGPAYRNAMAVNLLLRGIPQIYTGDEIAVPGANDPDNRRDFPGGFPGDETSVFDGKGLTKAQWDTLTWTRELLRLRRSVPALQTGRFTEVYADRDVLLALKQAGTSTALVLFYRGGAPSDFHFANKDFRPGLDGRYLPKGADGPELSIVDNTFSCPLEPYDVKIWIKE